MKEFNPKSTFPKSSDRVSKKRDSFMRKGESAPIVWKPARSQPLNIRMMTTKEGVSERVIHEQPCKIIDRCNYCPILDLPYKSQLLQKTNELKQKLAVAPAIFKDAIVKDCAASEDRFGYRHQIKLVVSEHFGSDPVQAKRWIDIGLYNQSINNVVDIGRCPVQTLLANDIAAFFRTGIRLHNLSVYTHKNRSGLIHSIVIRTTHASRQAQVIINVTKEEISALKPLARELAEKIMNIQGVFAVVSNPQQGELSENKIHRLVGQAEIEEMYSGMSMKYSPLTYLPTNPRLFNKIYQRISELADLSGRETVVEINSGAGELSCIVANLARNVIAIEPSAHAVQDATKNARLNSCNNVGFYTGQTQSTLAELLATSVLQNCDVFILNSKDEKTSFHAFEQISKLDPRTILFLTSSTQDLTRVGLELDKIGYKIVFIEPFDSFPGANKVHMLSFIQKK